MQLFKLFILKLFKFPHFLAYFFYDLCNYFYFKEYKNFTKWGIHLYTGKFGKGKTSQAVIDAYKLCCKYPQISLLTNIKIANFPEHTNILTLNNVDDILNAPRNTICLIDEIGTLFNSRDFSSGKKAVPKSLFQHLCQCRKRKLVIFGTVQRFNLLDKQIRDVTADVIACNSYPAYPFTRCLTETIIDIDEYELYSQNPTYQPKITSTKFNILKNQYRKLYDTSELVQGLLQHDYLTDEEILQNRGELSQNLQVFDKKGRKQIKNRKRL